MSLFPPSIFPRGVFPLFGPTGPGSSTRYMLRIGDQTLGRVDRAISRTRLERAVLWDLGGGSLDLVFTVRAVDMASRSSHKGKEVELLVDGVSVWRGDVRSAGVRDDRGLHTIEYTCKHIKHRADRIPVTDDLTRTDTCDFNMEPGPGYVAGRDGYSTGGAILAVLEMVANRAALDGKGIGRSVPGRGATSTCSLVGGGVGSASVDLPGEGYSASNPPNLVFVGGNPKVRATGTVQVDAEGKVSGVTVTGAGDYTGGSTPKAIITSYPHETALDLLEKFPMVPTHPITISGERLLDGIDACLKADYPTAALHILPDGTLRFYDLYHVRDEATRAVVSGSGVGAVLRPVVDPVSGAISRVDVVHAGHQYTGTPTVAVTGLGGGAVLDLDVDEDGGISGASVVAGGSMYRDTASVRVLPPLHRYARFYPSESIDECFGQVVYRGRPLVYAVLLTLSGGEIAESFAHSGLSNEVAKQKWRLADWSDPNQSGGQARGTITLSGSSVSTVPITASGFGYEPNSTYPLKFEPPKGGGSTATGTFSTDSDGVATGTTITSGGSGYEGTEKVRFAPPATGGRDYGSVGSPSTTESVTLTSSDPQLSLPADYWAYGGRSGVIHMRKIVSGGGVDTTEAVVSRRIISSSALSAGGTYTVQLDRPTPISDYTDYEIIGTRGAGSRVWIEYDVTIEGIKNSITTEQFSVPQAMASGLSSLVQRTSPYAEVWYDPDGDGQPQVAPIDFTVDPDRGKILFAMPTPMVFGAPEDLEEGGYPLSSGEPTDIRVLVGYYDGAMEVVAPQGGGYSGTAHDRYGVEDTLTIQDDSWGDPLFSEEAQRRAESYLKSVQDEIIEGELVHLGLVPALLSPGFAVEVGGYSYSAGAAVETGWEEDPLPVVRCELARVDSTEVYQVKMQLSNRYASYTGSDDMPEPRSGLQIGIPVSGAFGV